MLQKLAYNFQIGLESISQNRLRGILTSLGIIFGVASVIAMLAIGRGAQEEILEQMKILGANNIIIKPIIDQDDENDEEEENKKVVYSPGLTLADGDAIMELIPNVEKMTPEVVIETNFLRPGLRKTGKVVGVDNSFFDMSGFTLENGSVFSPIHMETASSVCVIGNGVKARFFPGVNPIGKQIKCGKVWLTVIGVANERNISEKNIKSLGIRDYNMDIYVPVKTVLLRFKNRNRITEKDLDRGGRDEDENEVVDPTAKNYHQLDKLTITLKNSEQVFEVAEVLGRMLLRRHNQVQDFEVIVPEQLLAQEQRTKKIFNLVLTSIASISLLVGGIGIMNIMLASVMERIKEIGVRLSLGATKTDIITQFLSEAISLSVFGGIVGILTGVLFSVLIESETGIKTIVTPYSVILSFFVSFSIGVLFGFFPARKAAGQDPVVSLRYE